MIQRLEAAYDTIVVYTIKRIEAEYDGSEYMIVAAYDAGVYDTVNSAAYDSSQYDTANRSCSLWWCI